MSDSKEKYDKTVEDMRKGTKCRKGGLTDYFYDFLKTLDPDEFWTQPEALKYGNEQVEKDGGVMWWVKKSNGIGKRNSDGTPANFGDGGRQIEMIRKEKFEGCWDEKKGEGNPLFRFNMEKYETFVKEGGQTKCHSFTSKIKKAILKRAGNKCELCGHKGKPEIDHFIPKEKGGPSTMENANALCSRCNDRKCNKEPNAFMKEEIDRLYNYFKERGMEEDVKNYFKTKVE
jgi:hypothetical protein